MTRTGHDSSQIPNLSSFEVSYWSHTWVTSRSKNRTCFYSRNVNFNAECHHPRLMVVLLIELALLSTSGLWTWASSNFAFDIEKVKFVESAALKPFVIVSLLRWWNFDGKIIRFRIGSREVKIAFFGGGEGAFLLPTQQPRVQITAPQRFFSLDCLVCEQYWDITHLVALDGFCNCS